MVDDSVLHPPRMGGDLVSPPVLGDRWARDCVAVRFGRRGLHRETRCKNTAKNFLSALESDDRELIERHLNEAQSALDKSVVKGVISRNTASCRKSKMALKLAALFKAESA